MKNSLRSLLFRILFLGCIIFLFSCKEDTKAPGWPKLTSETRPWTRWWWHGNALTKEGITSELEEFKSVGLGGVEITPIYGVYGYEDRFINYLSPEWVDLLFHTLQEGERLGLGIDMATGTGWPFGGPWIEAEHACKNVQFKVYTIIGGGRLNDTIQFIQTPYVRAVGSQIYEVHDGAAGEGRIVAGTRKEPLVKKERSTLTIDQLIEPISANKNLQQLALDQVQYKKPLKLQALMGYNESGVNIDLTSKVDANGMLNWTAPAGTWKLYAVFQGWHGKMVERAGPGGEGNVIDHFSKEALQVYLHRFDSVFKSTDISTLRAFFNDSYEVDDARGSADWTPMLFDEFRKRRGYDLRDHLAALFGHDNTEKNERVLSDYRETISELLLDNFTTPWRDWAHGKSAVVRNQAHGSPANILDLYATVDIPEIEGIEPLRIKMASSAGNVTGKKLISSESATWLNEHFQSGLSDIKTALDRFMLNGVNHIFYHGTAYSPKEEAWPGWLFYAAVHLNSRNPLWKDFDVLNQYVARCQSFLQNTSPDNDVLFYYPIYDVFAFRDSEMIQHFDGIGKQFDSTAFEEAAEKMLARGYSFDYLSDKQLQNLRVEKNKLKTEDGAAYKALVVPGCNYIPLATLKKIEEIAGENVPVIFYKDFPRSLSGFGNVESNKEEFRKILGRIREMSEEKTENTKGSVLRGDSLEQLLTEAKIKREMLSDYGIQFIRKKDASGNSVYLIKNVDDALYEGWLPLRRSAKGIVLYDPMTCAFGKAKMRISNETDLPEVFVQLSPAQTLIVEMYQDTPRCNDFLYHQSAGEAFTLKGPWQITFKEGGPTLPPGVKLDTLLPWTSLGEAYRSFSGVAVYSTSFSKPQLNSSGWLLDLGSVRESAEVIFNGDTLGTLIGPVYQLYVDDALIKEFNTLEIVVANKMANRIAYMDKTGQFWKKFYNVNFPSRLAENRVDGLFSAAHWSPQTSGLEGPVRISPRLKLQH